MELWEALCLADLLNMGNREEAERLARENEMLREELERLTQQGLSDSDEQ